MAGILPKTAVFHVAGMQFGGFIQCGNVDLRVFEREPGDFQRVVLAGGMFFLILDYLPHQPVEPGKFTYGIFFVCLGVEEVFVSV